MNFNAIATLNQEIDELVGLLDDGALHDMTALGTRDAEFLAGQEWSLMLLRNGHFLDREIRHAMQDHFEKVLVGWHQGDTAGPYTDNFMVGVAIGLVLSRHEASQSEIEEPDMSVEEI